MTDSDTLSERRARLSPSKQALLEKWRQAGAEPAANLIPRRSGSGPAPLSLAQERLWFLDRMEPGAPVYNLPLAIHLTGQLDVEALRQSLDALVRRHATLRTTFTTIDEQPMQVIAPAMPLPCPLADLGDIAEHERMGAAQQWMIDAVRRPFSLERGPLVRASLLRLGEQEHVLLLVMHHIISDGWSQRILIRELLALYDATTAGRPAPLAELPIDYADFAIWQREQLQGSGGRGQGTTPLNPPARGGRQVGPPAGGGTEGGRSQESDVGESQTQNSKLKTQNFSPNPPSPLQEQLAYWKRQLAGAPAALALPTDRPYPTVRTHRGARHHMRLSAALMASLQELSRQEGVTLYMTLLAAFNVLLSRYTGQHDLLVGSPVANRTRSEIAEVIGFFVNTLVLRTDLSGDPTFRELLARVRATALEMHANADVPFEKVVEIVQPERDLGRTPLFQVMFLFQNVPLPDMERGPLAARLLHVESETTQFDLILEMSEAVARFEYSTDIFDAATIARMAAHFETLLTSIAVDPDWPISALPLLTHAERRQLLIEWNSTAAPFPDDRCIQQAFEAQVQRTPEANALACDGATLTFAALNARANQLAHHLQSLGVGPEVRVGLCVERSIEMVVGLLGILKAGGAYVPLDPSYPTERLAFMLEDSRAAVLITTTDDRPLDAARGRRPTTDRRPTPRRGSGQATDDRRPTNPSTRLGAGDQRPTTTSDDRSMYGYDISYPNDDQRRPTTNDPSAPLRAGLRPQSKIQNPKSKIVNLDADWPMIAQMPVQNPASRSSADNIAYMIYTSGSTGRPKGVLGPHRGVVNRLHWMWATFPFALGEVCCHKTAIGFIDAVWELFGPLLQGVPLLIIPDALLTEPLALVTALAQHSVTRIVLVPSLLRVLLHTVPNLQRRLGKLKYWTSSGEALPAELERRFREQLPHSVLLNLYGSSEVAADATWHVSETDAASEHSLIGRPLANTQVYILDQCMQPVPIGVPGELYLGGVQLARGYHNRPDFTAERFIPNPFAQGMGDGGWGMGVASSIPHPPSPIPRLYRTGDLARYRPDGTIEFLGRTDHQVKIRGFRIEIGEIEAVLAQHPQVREAAVVTRDDSADDKRLVAYVVPKIEDRGLKIEDSASDARDPLSSILYPLSSELRAFLQEQLPDYMLPSAFVLLDALPHTPSGKLDRRALLDDTTPAVESAERYVAPRTPNEEVVGAIWADILRLERVGVHDNFFALGGHSLLAARLLARLNTVFHIQLPVRSIFEAPTVAGLTGRIEHTLRDDQGTAPPPIVPIDQVDHLPLSFAQQRLWFLDQLEPNSPTYNIAMALRLAGALDVMALAYSFDTLLQRHAALRTIFVAEGGRPAQVIMPSAPMSLPIVDLRPLPDAERAEEARRLAAEEAQRSFDLARGPMLRAGLLHTAEDEHILLVTTHHIVFDGSHEVFFRDLATLYNAFVLRTPAQLPELPVQYVDFAHWQRRWLAGEDDDERSPLRAQLAYWRRQLDGAPVALELPIDRPRPSMQTFQGAKHTFTLAPSLMQALKALCRQEGVTLFMTMLAAFQVLLKRYSNQERISVGTPIAQRSQAAVEHLIGCFVNTLVLHTDLSGDPSFRTVLGRVREVALGAYAHQDLPFEMLVEALQPQRDPSRNPFYQVMFVLQHAAGNVKFEELASSMLGIDGKTSRFDILLSCWESTDRLHGMVEYNTDLFGSAMIVRMFQHFQILLEGIIAQPDRGIGELPLLSETERRQILLEWDDTAASYERDVCMHQLFERQVARHPDALAVVFPSAGADRPDELLTYRELNRRANQLAHHLRMLGAGPGAMVAVYMDRSPEMIVAVLGVLKAGGTYVPLEVSFPRPRVQWIMESLCVRWVLTQSPQLQRIAAMQANLLTLAHVVCLDPPSWLEHINGAEIAELARPVRRWATTDLDGYPNTNLPATIGANALAYVIFTSGSTGMPKGVMVRHRPVINLIEWVNRTFDVCATDRLLFVTSLCFDLSVYDIFGILAAGGSIRVVADADLRDPERLLRMLCDELITFWDSAPAALQQLVPFFPSAPSATSRLRLVFLSGDWIPVTLPDQVRATFRGARVISLGGATEATVWSNYYPIGSVEPHWISIPYGKPIQNARYYILDERLNPCPIGVEGALYIGGECLCEGYAGQPDLTAERFIPNPFTDFGLPILDFGLPEAEYPIQNPKSKIQNGTRLYRTGDQARYLPNGTMIFLGRRDQQVKIRGYRIELGEIESVLGGHPDVLDVAVLAREDLPGDKRLVAYVVPKIEDRGLKIEDSRSSAREPLSSILYPLSSELRRFLQDKLPDYMVPSAFVVLDALPVTANGKLDRQALPAPRQEQSQEHAAPRTPIEQMLATIWGGVLRVDQVGIYDNFFALGGDSILSIQIIAHARQRGLHLTTRDMFRNQTIAELAARVGSGPAMVAEQDLLTGSAPLTPIQRWFFEHDFTAPEHWNQAVLLETRRPLNHALLERSFQRLIVHHDALRLRFTREQGTWRQAYTAPHGSACCTPIDLSRVPPEQQPRAITAEAERIQVSLDLASGQLIRAALFDLGLDTRQRLLIVIHHLAVDGVSWQIVLEDLQTVYEQLEHDAVGVVREPSLPAKTTSFKTWGERLAAYAQSASVRDQLSYWRDQPWADYEPLPLDFPDGVNTEETAEHVTAQLDPATTGLLLNDVMTMQHAQVEEVLLAALARAFARWSGADMLLIDLEGHGREALFDDVDLSRTVGWHTTIAPLLLQAPLEETPRATLQRVKEQLRQMPERGIGYGLLRYLEPTAMRDLAALPRPEVIFNYWGQFTLADSEAGLFAGARESPGALRVALNMRTHVLEISGVVRGSQLHLTWTYSRNLYRRATIEWLAETFLETLRDFVASVEAGEIGYAPSDFPLTQLNQQQLDKLVKVIERKS